MNKVATGHLIVVFIVLMLLSAEALAKPWIKGIYVTQYSLLTNKKLNNLIKNSRAVGINTFVIDLWRMTPRYKKNIKKVKAAGIRYVVRIVVFPRGGTYGQVNSQAYVNKKIKLARQAIAVGANEVQLDYIRYRVGTPSSARNEQKIHEIIKQFKAVTRRGGVPLQIAVFGETSYKPSRSIGQNVKLFAPTIDALNPMVYPSHYEPHPIPSKQPYKTILDSLNALHAQFGSRRPFKLYPYIETSNYRMPMSSRRKMRYIHEQIRAVQDGKADGWYAWSPNNLYGNLFRSLRAYKVW